jgi:acyl-coenzyme A synthetase/AMP-(fatty) acid ligase
LQDQDVPVQYTAVIEFVDEIPRSASGKALRRLLRDKELEKSQK